jgi:hypothetical protein
MAGGNTIRGLNDTSSFLEVHENDQEIVFPFIRHQSCDFLRQLVAEWVFEPKKTKSLRRFIFILLGVLDFLLFYSLLVLRKGFLKVLMICFPLQLE